MIIRSNKCILLAFLLDFSLTCVDLANLHHYNYSYGFPAGLALPQKDDTGSTASWGALSQTMDLTRPQSVGVSLSTRTQTGSWFDITQGNHVMNICVTSALPVITKALVDKNGFTLIF